MSYADGLLSTGEQIHYRTQAASLRSSSRAPGYAILAVVLAGLLLWLGSGWIRTAISGTVRTSSAGSTLVLFVGGIAVAIWTALRYINQEYVLTNRRVIQVEGVLNRNVDRQLAREDQRRDARAVVLRADARLRRPDRPDRVRERHRRDEDAAQSDRRSRRRCSTPSTSSRSAWSAQAGHRARRSATRPGRAPVRRPPAAAAAAPRRTGRRRRRPRPARRRRAEGRSR